MTFSEWCEKPARKSRRLLRFNQLQLPPHAALPCDYWIPLMPVMAGFGACRPRRPPRESPRRRCLTKDGLAVSSRLVLRDSGSVRTSRCVGFFIAFHQPPPVSPPKNETVRAINRMCSHLDGEQPCKRHGVSPLQRQLTAAAVHALDLASADPQSRVPSTSTHSGRCLRGHLVQRFSRFASI